MSSEPIFEVKNLTVAYGGKPAIEDISFDIGRKRITALIGPSGCGKSTMLRCFNRMNDLIPGATRGGAIIYHGQDLYAAEVDPVEVRKRIGMVFQKPNPFPKSIYDNIAFGPRVIGMKGRHRRDRGAGAARELRSGTRSRIASRKTRTRCRAASSSASASRAALAVEPDVILMDEPCSALDPIATARIEDLMLELRSNTRS